MGSVPIADPEEACRVIFKEFDKIPFWPQLPRRSFLENMYVQYAERLPGAVIDEPARTIHVDSTKAAEGIEEVYAKYLANDIDYFRISPERAGGFYAFLKELETPPAGLRYVKGTVTGPVSFGLSVTDEKKQPIIYHKDMFEVLTKFLIMKARWQIAELKKRCDDVIIFIDEPYLISIGSSYINVNIADAAARIEELSGAIKEAGALAGVHCCGNTDWSVLLKRNIDILSFDTYSCAREFALYASDIKAFLEKGGTIAWGIVPSSEAIEKETAASLVERLKAAIALLTAKGIPADISSLITSSCGVGSLDEPRARRILEMTKLVSSELQK